MQTLQEAFDARNKKQNKIEKIKQTKNPIEVINNLKTICEAGYENLSDENSKYFFKCYGIFDKGENSFMIRVRVPAGRLNNAQALTIGNLAKKHGQDYIDLTTRQQIELRYIKIENLYEVLTSLDSVGITTYQTGVDNLRNIVTDALDNISYDSIINTFPIIEKLQDIFLRNDEYVSVLPRKFNTAICGSVTNTCNIFGHDCCFSLASKDGEYGFNVYLGGRVGTQAQDANIFLKEDDVELFFSTLLSLFKEFGFRDNRNKNRLVFLINAVGMDTFIKALKDKANCEFQSAGINLIKSSGISLNNKIQQKDKNISAKIIVPSGITSGSDIIDFSNLSLKYGSGDLRLSYDQNIYVINIKKDLYSEYLKEDIIQKYSNFQNAYFNDMIACAGTKTCSFAVIPNKEDAIDMANYLNNEIALSDAKIRMNWSACVKGCGVHGIADIGFEGAKAKDENGNACDGVHIFLGGKITNIAKEAYVLFKNVPLMTARVYVKYLIISYKNLKNSQESFEEFETRVLSKYTHQALVFYCMVNHFLEKSNLAIFDLEENPKTLNNERFEIFDFGLKLYRLLTKESRYQEVLDFSPTLNNKIKENEISNINKDVPQKLNDIIFKMTQFDKTNRYQVFSEIVQELKG